MKCLKCSEVCQAGCEFVIEGESERKIIRGMLLHGELFHKELMRDMDDSCREHIVKLIHTQIVKV